jgi:hypothetical protein
MSTSGLSRENRRRMRTSALKRPSTATAEGAVVGDDDHRALIAALINSFTSLRLE